MKYFAILILFSLAVQGTLGATCLNDGTQIQVSASECLPNACVQQFIALNAHHIKPLAAADAAEYHEVDREVKISFSLVENDNSAFDTNFPTVDCFTMVAQDIKFSDGSAQPNTQPVSHDVADQYNTVNFEFPVENIPDLCEYDTPNEQYECTSKIKYTIKDSNDDFYDVNFVFTIKLGDATAEVIDFAVGTTNGNANDASTDITIPATLTRWNSLFDTQITDQAANPVEVGEEIYVKLIADQTEISHNYLFTLKSARFYINSINIPVTPVATATANTAKGSIFELHLTFKAAFPSTQIHLEVVGEVAHKSLRFLKQNSVTRVGKGQIDVVVTEDKTKKLDDKKQQATEEEGQDTLTIVLIVMASIIGIMVPGAIVFSIIKYKKLMSQKKYEEDLYRNDRSAISDIQSSNTITQGADQQNKNNALSIHV